MYTLEVMFVMPASLSSILLFMWTMCTNLEVTPEALCGHMTFIHELEARKGGYQD